MEMSQVVKASAEVVTITRLKRGDVYKRLERDYSGNATIRFGIVTGVMFNGTEGAVTALEYSMPYGSLNVGLHVIATDGKDEPIFAAEPEELTNHFSEVREALQNKVDKARAELGSAIDQLNAAISIFDRDTLQLTVATTVRGELTSTKEDDE